MIQKQMFVSTKPLAKLGILATLTASLILLVLIAFTPLASAEGHPNQPIMRNASFLPAHPPLHSSTPLLFAQAITATKAYTIATDNDADNRADPGDVLSYTIVISNNGSSTADGLIFTDTLDPNTSLDGLMSVSPVALDDSYNTLTSPVTLDVPDGPTDLFANDYPGLNPAVSGLSSFGGGSLGDTVTTNLPGSTAAGADGSLTVNADGSFVFTPTLNFEGVFTFSYRLQNPVAPADGLASITVDAPPNIVSTTPLSGATGVDAATNITLDFNETVDIAASGISLGCPNPITFTPTLPQTDVDPLVLDPDTDLPDGATCTVIISATAVTDTDTFDPPDAMLDDYSFSFAVASAGGVSFNMTPR